MARLLFPEDELVPLEDGDLSFTNPADDVLIVGCFPGVSVVAAAEVAMDRPSELPQPIIDAGRSKTVYLHAMHSVVDWFAYAQWTDGKLVRSLSLAPDHGTIEDIGQRLAFEEPYWAGQHPPFDEDDEDDSPYPFVFHPLELGEAALKALFGYQLEGYIDESMFEPETVPLLQFKRVRPGS